MEGEKENEIQRIKRDIALSGFPLEIEVSSILRNDGWNVRNQVYYIDNEEGKPREIDIIAHKAFFERMGDYDRFNISLIIECKKSDKPWVFFTTPRELSPSIDIELLALVKQFSNPELIRSLAFIKWLQKENHYSYDNCKEYAVISYEPFKKGTGREILEATHQVTKALNFQLDEFRKATSLITMNPVFILYPIIAFDGHLYESKPQAEDMELRRCSHLEYFISRKELFLIDILEKNYLPEFLKNVNKEVISLKDLLKQ